VPTRKLFIAPAAVGSVVLAAGCSSSSSGGSGGGSSSGSTNAATATSASAFGGMSGLVAACKKEGTLNVITLPANWANYGTIMKDFSNKYGVKINDANPDGSSQDEINAMQQLKGQSRAPDVLDMGTSFAIKADQEGLLAPYKVATYSAIPANSKASDSSWYDDYGGYVAIGYDPSKVKVPPTSFADLMKPIYKNQVAINGNPTQASAAFSAVYASALANGGSLSNIEPGILYFKKLHQVGNFVPVTAGPTTVQSGQTPIVIWWDYLLASEIQLQDRDPDRRALRGVLQPGDQQDRPEPGLRPAVGGVSVLDHRAESVAAGHGPPDRAADTRQQRHREQGRPIGAACGPGGRPPLPDPGAGVGRRGQGGAAVGEPGRRLTR